MWLKIAKALVKGAVWCAGHVDLILSIVTAIKDEDKAKAKA